jgi:hypothetical protein
LYEHGHISYVVADFHARRQSVSYFADQKIGSGGGADVMFEDVCSFHFVSHIHYPRLTIWHLCDFFSRKYNFSESISTCRNCTCISYILNSSWELDDTRLHPHSNPRPKGRSRPTVYEPRTTLFGILLQNDDNNDEVISVPYYIRNPNCSFCDFTQSLQTNRSIKIGHIILIHTTRFISCSRPSTCFRGGIVNASSW